MPLRTVKGFPVYEAVAHGVDIVVVEQCLQCLKRAASVFGSRLYGISFISHKNIIK